RRMRGISTPAWISSRSRCARDARRRRGGDGSRGCGGTARLRGRVAHMSQPTGSQVPGLFTLVLHTHLPWLAHHGRWPVGEDRHRLITLGMTPVVTAQLDDPYCLDGMHHWLANWQLRAAEAASIRPGDLSDTATSCTPEALRSFGIREFAETELALDEFTTWWGHGGSPQLRALIDAGTVELL